MEAQNDYLIQSQRPENVLLYEPGRRQGRGRRQYGHQTRQDVGRCWRERLWQKRHRAFHPAHRRAARRDRRRRDLLPSKLGDRIESLELTQMDERGAELRSIRGKEISMIFQEPMSSFSPFYTVGDQIAENLLLHQGISKEEATRADHRFVAPGGHPQTGTTHRQLSFPT